MEEKKKVKMSISTILLIFAIIIIIIMAIYIYKINNEKTDNMMGISTSQSNENSENKTGTDLSNEKEEKIKQFLTSGKVISTASSIGAGDPEMYYFLSNGNFSYIALPYFNQEGQTISHIGKWKIENNKLVLNVQKEKKVKGGKMVTAEASDPIDHLENYTEVMSESAYTKEYLIYDLIEDKEKTYNDYYLKLDKMELFQLNIGEDDSVKELKSLAENGYENKSNESENTTSIDEDDGPQPMNKNIDSQSTSSKTVPQLAGNFYEIKSIIKEYRENEKVKNYKDFNYDLDSDGTIDKITLKHIINEKEEEYSSDRDYYSFEYNGKPIYDHWDGFGSVGIVDLDSRDKYLDIWVYDDGPSDDPGYYFFRKVGNKIIKMGELGVERGFLCDGKGRILSAHRDMPWIIPQVFNCYYTIENNKFKKHALDFSYNKNYEYTSSTGFFTTDLENLKKFEKDNSRTSNKEELIAFGKKYNINKLDKNEKFKLIEFIKAEAYSPVDIKVKLSDGTEGYLIHPYGRFYIYD
ncbi:MAG: hypothetical protein IJK18_06970 [Clostridia bacterium]|nr:hypothetical protein [Clostridia bacterium]